MSSQIVCLRGCIITLVALVQLLPTVHFQMGPQCTRVVRGKATLVAVV